MRGVAGSRFLTTEMAFFLLEADFWRFLYKFQGVASDACKA